MNVVSVFPLTESFELYLMSVYQPVLKRKILKSVSGVINKGETSLVAAKRALKEEAGVKAYQWEEVARLNLSPEISRSISHLFVAKGLEITDRKENKNSHLEKIKLSEAGKKAVLGEIYDTSSSCGILLLEALKRSKKL